MKKSYASALVLVFVFVFTFAMTLAVAAGGGGQQPECCTYENECGHTGYGAVVKYPVWTCKCTYGPGLQGWYNGCFYACPAACTPD